MKSLIKEILNIFLPKELGESTDPEKLFQAQVFIFILFPITICAFLGVIASSAAIFFSPQAIDSRTPFILIGATIGYASGLGIYTRTGNNVIGCNIMAATYYICIVIFGLQPISLQSLFSGSLYFLALPFLVLIGANYKSALFWGAMVSVAPLLWNVFGATKLELYYIGNWIFMSIGFYGVIYGSHAYLNRLVKGFNDQRDRLEFVAGHDALTGAANRTTFDRRLSESIARCQTHRTQSVLILIDLDKFKPINDAYGHHTGDIVLTAIATRLRQLVRRSDVSARLGGDEFALLLDQCSLESAKPIIDHVTLVVNEPIEVLGKHLNVGCSFGVAVCPDDGIDPVELTRIADERMYAAKRGSAVTNIEYQRLLESGEKSSAAQRYPNS